MKPMQRKPELETTDIYSLPVYHDVSTNHTESAQSRSSVERTLEEITFPNTKDDSIMNLPDRILEAKMYSSFQS